MAQHNDVGRWGEDIAVEYLLGRGCRIIERNWRTGHMEVDIIATDGQTLLFVEVKTRATDNNGAPHEAVDWRKRRNLMTAMTRYVTVHDIDMDVRFDIISVSGTPESHSIELLENAVSNFIG